jgi:tetratricopeptide (TPR) repeat protein
MRQEFARTLVQLPGSALLVFAVGLSTIESQGIPAEEDDRSLLTRLQAIEEEHRDLCPAALPGPHLTMRVKSLMNDFRLPTAAPRDDPSAIEAINHLLFDRLRLRASPDLKDPCNLLPSRILDRRRGYCVGIVALYLLLAEQADSQVHAVATPSHVFVRFDDGTRRVNIETLQGGKTIPDEQYIREYRIPARSLRGGVFMHDLTTDEFLAQVHNNLGVIYSDQKDYDRAALEYARALDLDPWLPAAWYNYASDLLRLGEHRRAARFFSKSLRLYPTDVWALNNRGRAYLEQGKLEKARRDFEEALRIEPGFEQSRRNLQSIH